MTTELYKLNVGQIPTPFYGGIDVHKHQLAVAIYGRDDSNAVFSKSNIFAANKQGMDEMWQFLSIYPLCGVAMEATGIYHHRVVTFLQQKQAESSILFEILVSNPADAAGIPGKQKCDRLDAMALARYYAAGLLKNGQPIIVVLEDLKALFRMNERLEKDRTALKNRIKKTFDRAGFRPKRLELNLAWINEVLFKLTQHVGTIKEFIVTSLQPDSILKTHRTFLLKAVPDWEPYYDVILTGTQRALIRQDLFDLDLKTARQTLLKVEIEKLLKDRVTLCDLAHNLTTIPGISPQGAMWLLAETGGIARFHSCREFLAYAGCIPRTVSSAGKIYYAHVSRHSNKYIRGIFYNAAKTVSLIVKQESRLKDYAQRMVQRKDASPRLAFCTISGKIARIAYTIMKQNVPFNPCLATNAKIVKKSVSNTFSIVEQKDLRKAKRALERVQQFKSLKDVSVELESLVRSLEEILTKK